MTVNKLPKPAKDNAVQEKINEIIDNLGDIDQTFDGTSANAQSGVAIATALTDGTFDPVFNESLTIGNSNLFYDTNDDILSLNGYSSMTIGAPITIASTVTFSTETDSETGDNILYITDDITSDTVTFSAQGGIFVDTSTSGGQFTYNGSEVATLSDIPSVPTVNNSTITFTQGGVTKGTITLNQSNNATIAFDAGSGGSSALSGLTDVTLTNPSNDQLLKYDGSKWVNNGLKTINSQSLIGSGSTYNGYTVATNATESDNIVTVYKATNSDCYAVSDIGFNFGAASSWTIIIKTKFDSSTYDEQSLAGWDTGTSFRDIEFVMKRNGQVCVQLSSNGSSYDIADYNNGNPLAMTATLSNYSDATWSYVKLEFTGTAYNLYHGTNINSLNLQATLSSSTKVSNKSGVLVYGTSLTGDPTWIDAKFDMTGCDVYIDGSLYWQAVSTSNNLTLANTDLSNLSTTGESHFGKVKSVNNEQPDSNGNVSITIPTVDQTYDSSSTNAQSGVAIANAGFLTSSDLTNYVTTNTDQNITGVKTFVGQKRIGFKQSSSSDKLGFTLYNNSGTEKGYLEFNPSNQVDSVPLMTLGNYTSTAAGLTHVGFRKYSSISGASGAYNLLAPLISDARTPFNLTTTYTNFYLPLGFTDGNTTVKTAKSGLVDLSSLLPTVPTKISDLTDDTATYPVDKADTLTNLTATVTELNYVDGVTSAIQTQFDGITDKIPSQATSSNQLADKAFVNSTIQTATANFRGNWDTWALVPTSASSYPTDYIGSTTPTVNDYMVVQDASDYTGDTLEGTWRFKYSGTWSTDGKSGWLPEYQVNETPLTSAQLAALNSGITSTTKVTHTASTAVGNGTTPVYVNSSGEVTALSYTLAKSVPSDAVFTDTTYSSFTGATSIAGGASGLVPAPSSGDDDKILTGGATWDELKTVNGTSLLGNGNIDTSEIFVANEDTTYNSILYAHNHPATYKLIVFSSSAYEGFIPLYEYTSSNVFRFVTINKSGKVYCYEIDSSDTWTSNTLDLVNKAGDTMTGNLGIEESTPDLFLINSNITKGTNPNNDTYWQILANDSSNSSTWQSTRLGFLEWSLGSSGTTYARLAAIENTANSSSRAQLTLSRTQEGVSSATFNCPLEISDSYCRLTNSGTTYFWGKNSSYNYTTTTAPSSNINLGYFQVLDTNSKVCGGMAISHNTSNNMLATMYARRSISGTEKSAYVQVWVDSSGTGHSSFPQTECCDGQWISANQDLITSSTSLNGSTALTYTINLPNDNHTYEVIIRGRVATGSTSGNYVYLMCNGNVIGVNTFICGCRTRSASTVLSIGSGTVFAKYGSKNLEVVRNTGYNGTCEALSVIAYRRVGTNT